MARSGTIRKLIVAAVICTGSLACNFQLPIRPQAREPLPDPCAPVRGKCFRSIELLPSFGGEPFHWVVNFRTDGTYDYRYSDVEELGSYSCSAGQIQGQSGQPGFEIERSGTYEPTSGVVTWGVGPYEYQAVEGTSGSSCSIGG
ncbi:MAG TPA: hypothetical protein VGM03_13820 [Phycisphaerae bacterium]|jgi:hypothetical protein